MQPFKEEILRAASTILVALKTYTDEHGSEYPKTVDASHSMEEEVDRAIANIEPDRETTPQHPPRRRSWTRLMYLVWHTSIAQTEAALVQTSKALHWVARAFGNLGDSAGDRLPSNFPACHACRRRELETECRFARNDAICVACLQGVVERANRGRQPGEPEFTSETIEELLSLRAIPEWKRRDDDGRYPTQMHVRVRRFRTIMRSDESVRRRWLVALAPVVMRLRVFEETRNDERNLDEE